MICKFIIHIRKCSTKFYFSVSLFVCLSCFGGLSLFSSPGCSCQLGKCNTLRGNRLRMFTLHRVLRLPSCCPFCGGLKSKPCPQDISADTNFSSHLSLQSYTFSLALNDIKKSYSAFLIVFTLEVISGIHF